MIFQVISVFDSVAVAFSSWMTLISFYEADFWHFTDPNTTGLSVAGAIVLILSFCVTPLFLASKSLRLVKINVIIVFLLKILPSLLLMISSLPQLAQSPWLRTGLLAFGVAMLPFVVSLILTRSTNCLSAGPKLRSLSPKVNNIPPTQVQTNRNDENPTKLTQSFDNFVDAIVLTAVLVGMSIRYCTVTINIFYEDWRYSCALFVFVFVLTVLKSALEYVEQKKFYQSMASTTIHQENDVVDNRSSCTAQISFEDKTRSKQETPRVSQSNSNNSRKNSDSSGSPPNKQTVFSWSFVLTVNISGCVHGVTTGLLVLLFVWFFSTPNFFCRLSDKEPYNNGVFVVLGLMVGVLASLLFRPEKVCADLYDVKQKTLSEKEITSVSYIVH